MSDDEHMRRTGVFAAALALFIGCVLIEAVVPALRYIKYVLPGAAALLVAGVPPPSDAAARAFRSRFTAVIVTVVACVAISLIVTLGKQTYQPRVLAEGYFLLGPLVLAYLIIPHLDPCRIGRYARATFLAAFASYILEHHGDIFVLVRQPSQLAEKFLTSSGGAESGLSFVFGLFCLYFLCRGERRWSFAAFVLVVLSFKRIAIFGTLVGALVYVVQRTTRIDVLRYRRALPVALVAINAVVLLVLYLLARGVLDDLVRDYTGLPANWVTMGRADMYDAIFTHEGFSWLGRGLGSISLFLQGQGMEVGNAHSDIIKYTIELGPLMSAALVAMFYRHSMRTLSALVLMIYVNILLITDNVSIYFTTMFAFYLLQAFSDQPALAREVE